MNYEKPMAPVCEPEYDFGKTVPPGTGVAGGLYLKNESSARNPDRMNPPKQGKDGNRGKPTYTGKMSGGGGTGY